MMNIDRQLKTDHLLLEERVCRVCGVNKNLLSDFHLSRSKNPNLPSSYSYECKECARIRVSGKYSKMSKINRTDKIDTQGMSGPSDPNYDPTKDKTIYKPMIIKPRRLFTPEYVKEMKILINEVLDERDYKKKLDGPYDNPTPPGISYFDTEHFMHPVGEEEPEYPIK